MAYFINKIEWGETTDFWFTGNKMKVDYCIPVPCGLPFFYYLALSGARAGAKTLFSSRSNNFYQ